MGQVHPGRPRTTAIHGGARLGVKQFSHRGIGLSQFRESGITRPPCATWRARECVRLLPAVHDFKAPTSAKSDPCSS